MSFPRYPHYKPSGVEWLGEVPEHWEICRLGTICSKIGSGKTPSGGAENYETSGILFIRSQNVHDHGLMLDDAAYISDTIDSELSSSRVKRNDILLNITGASIGRTCIVSTEIGNANVNQHVCIIRMKNTENAFFVSLSLKSSNSQEQIAAMQTGAARDGLNYSQISRILTAFPPHDEQKNIITFLVQETAKIDALVAEQQRLIELLKEKRQAVISHAVTKGLDPTVPMKPSGIEWLGDIPAHWSAIQIGKVCHKVADGPHFSPDYVEEGVPFLSARNIRVNEFSLEDVKYISVSDCDEFDRRVIPQNGDVLYTKGGTTGIARVADFTERFQVWVHIAVLKLKRVMADPYFVAFSLNSIPCYEQSQLLTRGATNNDLGLTRMIKIWFVLPPLDEQVGIVRFLDDATAKLDTLTAEAERAIELLQERRTALISAAVTGQIDVRQLAQGVAA